MSWWIKDLTARIKEKIELLKGFDCTDSKRDYDDQKLLECWWTKKYTEDQV